MLIWRVLFSVAESSSRVALSLSLSFLHSYICVPNLVFLGFVLFFDTMDIVDGRQFT